MTELGQAFKGTASFSPGAVDTPPENISLIEHLAEFSLDPLGFVMFAFPWGEEGELESQSPEPWQIKVLEDLRDGLIDISEVLRMSRTSGHGIGKSALVAWIILWAMSTHEDTKGVVTANTENQLKTKTWVELAKWFRLFIAKDSFELTATALFARDPTHAKEWRIDMVPWSERNTESFAGLHNQGKRLLIVFDEASAIPDIIWEVTEGALTDKNTQIIWCAFGNPTRNKGRFRECFPGGRFSHRWNSDVVDSRSVSFTNKDQIQKWIDDYGEDSDFVRVRVRGIFPRIDAESFISYTLATSALNRGIEPQNGFVILGVDVGRFGDDPSCIYPRCGRDAVSRPVELYQGLNTMQLVAKIVIAYQRYSAIVVMVDEGGVGGGVVDRLRQLRIPTMGVDFGSGPDGTNLADGSKYANKRAEIWGAVRNWLPGGAIPDMATGEHTTLVDELTGPTYMLNGKEAIQLETKKDMRRRGVPSPNVADALATTFAYPHYEIMTPLHVMQVQPSAPLDYDPFTLENIGV